MKKPFQKGEWAAIYHDSERFTGKIVSAVGGIVIVQTGLGIMVRGHEKQCRRIIRVPKSTPMNGHWRVAKDCDPQNVVFVPIMYPHVKIGGAATIKEVRLDR